MHTIHWPKFIIKICEHFSQISQFRKRVQNFISLNLKEKPLRYAFFFESKHSKLKSPVKISAGCRCAEGFNLALKGTFWFHKESLTFMGPAAYQNTAVFQIGANKIPPNFNTLFATSL